MSTSVQAAKKALGELFIMGFNGLELSESTSAFIQSANIGGVILFSPNYETPGQVAELINQIQSRRTDLPLWVSVDHEGGRVQRFKKEFTKIPEAMAITALDSPKLTFEIAEVMAKELKAVGINLNYAPVADINTNPKNPVIGARAFGNNEETVTKMTTAVVRGHLLHKVQPCVKHFPGHGDTSQDSHFALPKVDTDEETLMEREFKPFVKAFRSHCAMVMTAHIICSKLDPERPATLSSKILTDILRNRLRYTGLIISDDLEMKAITDHFGPEDAPRLAIEAGCDLLIYRTEAATRAAHASLTKALESGKLDPKFVLEAEKRSKALKKEVLLPYHETNIAELPEKVGTPENQAVIDKLTSYIIRK
jgi:beta-N-acetylhexosaminidase